MMGMSDSTGMADQLKGAGSAQSGRLQQAEVQEAGAAGGQDVDHRARDDLVHLVLDRQHGVERGHQPADQAGRQQAHPQAVKDAGKGHGGKGAREHHALDGDVDDARPLAKDAGHRAQGQGRGRRQRGLDHARQVHARAAGDPHQESQRRPGGPRIQVSTARSEVRLRKSRIPATKKQKAPMVYSVACEGREKRVPSTSVGEDRLVTRLGAIASQNEKDGAQQHDATGCPAGPPAHARRSGNIYMLCA